MPDIFLRPGAASPNDVTLRDPTLADSGGGVSLPVGLALETDLALARPLGLVARRADETDSALTLAVGKRIATGISAETDAALAETARKQLALGISLESDASIARPHAKILAVGMATESAASLPLSFASPGHAVGIATESDSAFSVTASKRVAVGLALESDSAQASAFGPPLAFTVRMATEADTATAPPLQSGLLQSGSWYWLLFQEEARRRAERAKKPTPEAIRIGIGAAEEHDEASAPRLIKVAAVQRAAERMERAGRIRLGKVIATRVAREARERAVALEIERRLEPHVRRGRDRALALRLERRIRVRRASELVRARACDFEEDLRQ